LEFFNLILLNPIINVLIVLSHVFFDNFGLAIIILTIIVRFAILPLTLKQLRASKAMSEGMRVIQPKLQQIKKKYAKDKQKLQQETMKLYKEAGVSPMGCLSSPMLVSLFIQLPIFIAVYRAIIRVLATTPQDFLGLSENLYSWSIVHQALPVSGKFLWLNLGSADPYLLIPILVGVTMWVSQKMITQPSLDPQQESMQRMMQLMMPLMFGFICLTLPSGLGLYFVASTIFSVVVQYYIYGWGNLFAPSPAKQVDKKKVAKPEKRKAEITAPDRITNPKEEARHGKSRGKRQDSRGSRSAGSGAVGSQQGGGGGDRSEGG
jgi:YidC/Oxa1 family membrane protein insertase